MQNSPKPPAGGNRWAASPASIIRLSQLTNFSATSACITHGLISMTSMSESSWPTNLKINFSHIYKKLSPSKKQWLTWRRFRPYMLNLMITHYFQTSLAYKAPCSYDFCIVNLNSVLFSFILNHTRKLLRRSMKIISNSENLLW